MPNTIESTFRKEDGRTKTRTKDSSWTM